MATSANLSTIIRYYADKQKSPFIDLKEFSTYIKKYAEHHVEEEGELVKYLGDPTSTLTAELAGLTEKHIVAVINANNKKTIVSIAFFSQKFASQYTEMALKDGTIPFPNIKDLPKQFPVHVLEHKNIQEYLTGIIDKPNPKSTALYVLEFTTDVPGILVPASVTAGTLVNGSKKIICRLLKKDDYHDYYLKKLRSTNPTKEITIKNFFTHFVDAGLTDSVDLNEGDEYYIWNQTLYYIRQDFEKIQDRTTEDTSVLQAVELLEIQSSYVKEKLQNDKRREDALKALEANLSKSPFFYSMNQILKFQDNNGKLLYGQYTEDDLRNYLTKLTTESSSEELPTLLVFKVESGTRYYTFKNKVIQLVIRLCNEAHESIKTAITEKWYNSLLDYKKLPEMTDDKEFEFVVQDMVKTNSPVLWALLNANFMSILSYEKDVDEKIQSVHIFADGQLLPYAELLMLKREKLLSYSKVKLPFYYTIPVISWLLFLFHNGSKSNKSAKPVQPQKSGIDFFEDDKEVIGKPVSKQEALANRAKEISKDLIPEGSTIDRELNYLNKQWNKMLTKEANVTLTEDVNALIRDYTRRVMRSLSNQTFTKERVENLAKTLVNTPNMQKIKEDEALTEYVTLYMLRLISNV